MACRNIWALPNGLGCTAVQMHAADDPPLAVLVLCPGHGSVPLRPGVTWRQGLVLCWLGAAHSARAPSSVLKLIPESLRKARAGHQRRLGGGGGGGRRPPGDLEHSLPLIQWALHGTPQASAWAWNPEAVMSFTFSALPTKNFLGLYKIAYLALCLRRSARTDDLSDLLRVWKETKARWPQQAEPPPGWRWWPTCSLCDVTKGCLCFSFAVLCFPFGIF